MVYIIFIAGVLNLILGITTLTRARTRVQRQFGYLVLFIAAWVFVNFVYFHLPRYPYVHLSYSVGAILITAIFFWVVSFAERSIHSAIRWGILVAMVVVASLSLVPGWVVGEEMRIGPVQYVVTLGPLFILYAVFGTLVFISATYVLLRAFIQTRGTARLRMTYVVLGFTVPIAMIIVVDFILPAVGVLWSTGLDSPTSLIFAGFISYAILRHRFFDIRIVIRKGLVQFFTFFVLFAIYAYALLLIQRSTSTSFTLSSNTSLLVTVFIIGITIEPLRKGIYRVIDSIVASRERDRKEALERMQLMTTSITTFQRLLERTQQELEKTIGTRVDFLLADRRRQMLSQFPSGPFNESLEHVACQRIQVGKILIAEELPYRIENGESSLAPVQDWMVRSDVSAVVPIGVGEDLVGAFLFRGVGKVVYTADTVRFMNEFQAQTTYAIAGAYAYKLAVERIGQK